MTGAGSSERAATNRQSLVLCSGGEHDQSLARQRNLTMDGTVPGNDNPRCPRFKMLPEKVLMDRMLASRRQCSDLEGSCTRAKISSVLELPRSMRQGY
jgi:hypothetical protein